jgi:hypothetical protein
VGKNSGIKETPQELPEAAAPPIKKTTTGKKTGDLGKLKCICTKSTSSKTVGPTLLRDVG